MLYPSLLLPNRCYPRAAAKADVPAIVVLVDLIPLAIAQIRGRAGAKVHITEGKRVSGGLAGGKSGLRTTLCHGEHASEPLSTAIMQKNGRKASSELKRRRAWEGDLTQLFNLCI